jgi:hypothetical protein
MDAETEIKCLNELILQYEEAGDIAKLKPLLAECFTILSANGEHQDRQVFLNAVESNKNRGRRSEQPQVQLAGDTALYTCIVETTQDPAGTSNPGRFLNTRMFIHEEGEWRCTAWQVTRIPQPQYISVPNREDAMKKPEPTLMAESSEQEKTKAQLREIVLDHLGIPRPGQRKHIDELQDTLLPAFMETAQHAWMATSPYQLPRTSNSPADPILAYLHAAAEINKPKIKMLNDILEELGVHALLEDVAASPHVAKLGEMTLDPYEARLLRATGHPDPREAALEYLRLAAQNPGWLSASDKQLEKAADASLKSQSNITNIINVNIPPAVAPGQAAKRPKRRHLFTGLGALFSGLVLTTGNAIFIPSVPLTVATAIPIAGSLAAGVAAIGKGAGELREEGEDK